MRDHEIIELYWARNESAITATAEKYGNYCHTIAYNILRNKEDAEECANDTYLGAWNSIPPQRPTGWAKLGTMVACLALVLCTGIATHAIRSNATAGTFTMDVNPSVEYTIAKSGIVKNVRCLNSDAENALSDVALGKQSVETALTRTVAAYEACGYMENGEATVLISFDSRLDANAELKASLSAEIRKALEQTDAVGTLVFHSELTENAEVAKIAEEFHVSLGRADWILTAANKTGLPTDEVARMSLDELLKFQEVSGISSVSVSKFISLEEAKKIALKDAKLDELVQKIVFTREELSRNQGKPCYILEFYTDKCAYSYKIDAVSGEVIGKKDEWFSRQESETVPDTSQNSDSKHR